MDCWICRSNTGEKRISPGPTIFEGEYWPVITEIVQVTSGRQWRKSLPNAILTPS